MSTTMAAQRRIDALTFGLPRFTMVIHNPFLRLRKSVEVAWQTDCSYAIDYTFVSPPCSPVEEPPLRDSVAVPPAPSAVRESGFATARPPPPPEPALCAVANPPQYQLCRQYRRNTATLAVPHDTQSTAFAAAASRLPDNAAAAVPTPATALHVANVNPTRGSRLTPESLDADPATTDAAPMNMSIPQKWSASGAREEGAARRTSGAGGGEGVSERAGHMMRPTGYCMWEDTSNVC